LLNELRVSLEPVLPIEVVQLGRCNPFILLDSSVLELKFPEWLNLWNCGLWWQAPCTSLHLLIAKLGVTQVSLIIPYHSFTHNSQPLVLKVFTQESGSPCERMSTLTWWNPWHFSWRFLLGPEMWSVLQTNQNSCC
jgi:hypothetical protein